MTPAQWRAAVLVELRRIREALERAQPKRLYTAKAAARELGIGITKFMELLRDDLVRRVELDGTLMVPASELERLSRLPERKSPAPRQRSAAENDARAEYEKTMKRYSRRG